MDVHLIVFKLNDYPIEFSGLVPKAMVVILFDSIIIDLIVLLMDSMEPYPKFVLDLTIIVFMM